MTTAAHLLLLSPLALTLICATPWLLRSPRPWAPRQVGLLLLGLLATVAGLYSLLGLLGGAAILMVGSARLAAFGPPMVVLGVLGLAVSLLGAQRLWRLAAATGPGRRDAPNDVISAPNPVSRRVE